MPRPAGLAGRGETGAALRVYASAEAHSSIEKACMTLGIGRAGLVRIPTNERYQLRPELLEAAIAEDRAAGSDPFAIVATLGTTGSTSVDPVAAIADVAEREGLWLHVDAAYAGAVALAPELRAPFAGWERADSIVINPHKWLFTPLDASLLLTRRMDQLRAAFSAVPEYLRTLDRTTPVRDYNEYQPQLGRRFRALKLWILLRYFGLDGLRRRIGHHVELGQRFADWIDADPDWERLAPVPFSTVCFRWRPERLAAGRTIRRSRPCSTSGTPPSSTRSTGPARCSCRTPGWAAGSRSACRSAACAPRSATSSEPGSSSAERPLDSRAKPEAIRTVDRDGQEGGTATGGNVAS